MRIEGVKAFGMRGIVEEVPNIEECVLGHAARGALVQVKQARGFAAKLDGVASVNFGGDVFVAVSPLIQNAADIRADLQRLKRDTESARKPSATSAVVPVREHQGTRWAVFIPIAVAVVALTAGSYFYFYRTGSVRPIDNRAQVLPIQSESQAVLDDQNAQVEQPKDSSESSLILQPPHTAFAQDKYAPLPEKVINARTIFYINDTGSSRFGDNLYQELEKWNRWEVVTDKKNADLILVLSQRDHIEATITTANATTSGHDTYATGTSAPIKSSSWHIFLIDPASGETVWVSSHTLGARLWQSWRSVARALLSDIQKRMK